MVFSGNRAAYSQPKGKEVFNDLAELIAAGRAALDGDSNDAEHDALYNLVTYFEEGGE